MVARSETADTVQEFVTQGQLGELTDSLNGTMSDLKTRFMEIDQKFGIVEQRVVTMEQVFHGRLTDLEESRETVTQTIREHSEKVQFLHTSKVQMETAFEAMETGMQHMIGQTSAEVSRAVQSAERCLDMTEHFRRGIVTLEQNTSELQRLMSLAENACREHHARLNKMESEPRSGGGGGKRDILDPKNLNVAVYEGDKKGFDKWRTSLEVYIGRFYTDADKIIAKLRRNEVPISVDDFNRAADEAEVDVGSLTWRFEELQRDAGIFLQSKLGTDPTSSVSAVGDGFVNMYAQLNQEYDQLGDESEGQLMADFVTLAGRKSANLKELKLNMMIFEGKL